MLATQNMSSSVTVRARWADRRAPPGTLRFPPLGNCAVMTCNLLNCRNNYTTNNAHTVCILYTVQSRLIIHFFLSFRNDIHLNTYSILSAFISSMFSFNVYIFLIIDITVLITNFSWLPLHIPFILMNYTVRRIVNTQNLFSVVVLFYASPCYTKHWKCLHLKNNIACIYWYILSLGVFRQFHIRVSRFTRPSVPINLSHIIA